MSVPCIIHPLQLVIKDSLFEDNHTKLLLAKVRKLVCYISHCSKASELLKKQIDFDHAQKNKSLTLDSRCGNKVDLNISYARETEKAKVNYEANNANNQDLIKLKNGNWLIT